MMKQNQDDIGRIEASVGSGIRRSLGARLRRAAFLAGRWTAACVWRVFEVAFSIVVLSVVALPCFLGLGLRRIFTGKAVFDLDQVRGEGGHPLAVRFFNSGWAVVRASPLFWHVAVGRFRLVGIGVERVGRRERNPGDGYVLRGKPGVFSLWYVREGGKVGHEGKNGTEWEYTFRRTLFGDLGLLLRTVPAMLMRSSKGRYEERVSIFDVSFWNVRMARAVEMLEEAVASGRRTRVFFVNPDCLNKVASGDRVYQNDLQSAELLFPDGSGITLACKLLGVPLIENVNGTDMLPFLCESCVRHGFTLFLLGAKPGVAAAMRENLQQRYSGLRIVGEAHGYFDRTRQNAEVVARINALNPDILLVAFGAPSQERWITETLPGLSCRLAIGVGGLFDFYSGRIPRAPRWLRETGLEWTFRLWQEPGRMWRRYVVGNPLFILRVLRWKARKTHGGAS